MFYGIIKAISPDRGFGFIGHEGGQDVYFHAAEIGDHIFCRLALNQHIRSLCREEHISVLWTTHLLDEVQPSDDLLILHQGRLVVSGQADALSLEHGGDLGSAFTRLTTSGAAQ